MAHPACFRKRTFRVFVSRPRPSIRRSATSGLAKISGPNPSHLCEHVRGQQASCFQHFSRPRPRLCSASISAPTSVTGVRTPCKTLIIFDASDDGRSHLEPTALTFYSRFFNKWTLRLD
ncbi:hypothetical protein CF326_g2796 [Tilletia indica]|nr:hypothetical protein CF326_g2796 [Tilletia indica]